MLKKVFPGDHTYGDMRVQSSHISTENCEDMASLYYNFAGKDLTAVNDTVTMSTGMLFSIITEAFKAGWDCEMNSVNAILHKKETNRAPTSIQGSVANSMLRFIDDFPRAFYNKTEFLKVGELCRTNYDGEDDHGQDD